MEESPSPCRIIRTSLRTFLNDYHFFTSVASLLVFPFSVSVLLSQALVPTSVFDSTIRNILQALFNSAGFPSSEFFSFLTLKLSQTLSSSIFTLPFTLIFLLMAKACIIHSLNQKKPTFPPKFSSFFSLYNSLLLTYVCNLFLLLSANAVSFFILFFAFNFFSFSAISFFFQAAGAVLYSIILSNALLVCNLALVSSGMKGSGGYLEIFKGWVLLRGRTSTALSLALPLYLAMAAVEALFHYRIFHDRVQFKTSSVVLEGLFIAQLYSILIVIDTIISCVFFKICKTDHLLNHDLRYLCRNEDQRTLLNEKKNRTSSMRLLAKIPGDFKWMKINTS